MANERDFYFSLSNDAGDIDSTLSELIGIKDVENDGKIVKIEYDAEGEVTHFIAGEVEDSQTIDVDVNEIPVGDGNDWVKASDWYSQKSITKYEFNEDIYFYFSSSSNVESLTIENFEYEINGEKEEFLTEENILKMRQGDPQDSSGTPRYEYSIYEFTEEDKNIVADLFPNGREILNDFNYYISRYDQFPQDDRWGITESYFLKLYEDGNKKKLLIQKFNYLNPSMELIPINSSYDFFFCFRPYENEKLYLAFDKETKIQYFLPPKSFSMTIAPNTTEEIEFSIYTIDETRYFGSEFENDESYYGPQIVFGSDPKGTKGFNNSCNLTLKQKAKIIAEDTSFTHICGSSNIDIRDNTEIITRHSPKVLLAGCSISIGENNWSDRQSNNAVNLTDIGSGQANIQIGSDCYINIVGKPILEMKDNANIVMEKHSWISMDEESRIDMDGSATFAMHSGVPSSGSSIVPIEQVMAANGYNFIFTAQTGYSQNERKDPRLSNFGPHLSSNYIDFDWKNPQISGYKQTDFIIEGPNTYFFVGSKDGEELIKIGSNTNGKIYLDITSGEESNTRLKFGANADGKLQCYLTGDDMFIEYADSCHTEMHGKAMFIMNGNASKTTAYGDIGHFDIPWTTPMHNTCNTYNAPILQLYHESSFSMYGAMHGTRMDCDASTITFKISFTQDELVNLTGDAAQFLQNNIPSSGHNFSDSEKDIALDLFYIASQKCYNVEKVGDINYDQNIFIKELKRAGQGISNVILFSTNEESYPSSSTLMPYGAKKCIFSLQQSYYDSTEGYIYEFSIKYLLYGDDENYRMIKISGSPLCEIADDSEFRMWDNSLIKVDQLNGIKITNDSNPSQNTTPVSISVEPATNLGDQTITISDGVDSITFSIAQLKTALNIQPVGNNLF